MTADAPVTTIASLRESLCSEATPLPLRFRALFSLKHLARHAETPAESQEAIDAIAAGFASPSALLKHELAYCLGQSANLEAAKPLRAVLSNVQEDPMCRHEAAEALGALGDVDSLALLKQFRDSKDESDVITETCELAIDRIEWENSEERKQEKLRQRFVHQPIHHLERLAHWLCQYPIYLRIFIANGIQRLCLDRSSPSHARDGANSRHP